jgi:multicomponent Na+:H+ antiporter subunit D
MDGLGRVMPVMLGCYTLVSLALIGIPPASGFVSKWYLATGALASGTGVWSWLGPIILLISALLTAGYLLPLAIRGFFPGAGFDEGEIRSRGLGGQEPSWLMTVPMLVLTAGAILFGCFPGQLISMLESIAAAVL